MKKIPAFILAITIFSLAQSMLWAKPIKIAVFIPGARAGSATYDDMAKGVERAVAETAGAELKILEAGFNQAEWEEKLTGLVAGGEYDFLVTSNPSLPELCAKVSLSFPKQKFICLDGMLGGNPQISTVLYNQTEQGYVTGYLAGLITTGSLPGANADKRVGLIMGQHYPVMDKVIIPGFEGGLKAVDPAISLDSRVLGNWFDANKASDLAKSMIDSGVDVILPICGGASQGAIKMAQDKGKYILMFDGDLYSLGPKTVVGCTALRQERLAYERLKAAIAGKLAFGTADVVGMREGYVEFLDKDPSYIGTIPAELRAKMDLVLRRLKSGELVLAVPSF